MTPINHYEGDRERVLKLMKELVRQQGEMLMLMAKHPEIRKQYAPKVEQLIKQSKS